MCVCVCVWFLSCVYGYVVFVCLLFVRVCWCFDCVSVCLCMYASLSLSVYVLCMCCVCSVVHQPFSFLHLPFSTLLISLTRFSLTLSPPSESNSFSRFTHLHTHSHAHTHSLSLSHTSRVPLYLPHSPFSKHKPGDTSAVAVSESCSLSKLHPIRTLEELPKLPPGIERPRESVELGLSSGTDMVVCRICEQQVARSLIERHSRRCTDRVYWEMKLHDCDRCLRKLR
jgi:hypothetical protein